MALLGKRIKSSSIVEVIVAQVIAVIIFLLGLMIFLKIGKEYNQAFRLKSLLLVKHHITSFEKERHPDHRDYVYGNLIIKEDIQVYDKEKSLSVITVTAESEDGRHILSLKEIYE